MRTDAYTTKNKEVTKTTTCEQCGECLGQIQTYQAHLENKQTQLKVIMDEFCQVEPIIGMETPYHFRNKVFSVFDHEKEGPICGVYKKELNKVVPVNDCALNSKKASAIIETIRGLLKSFKIKTYDAKTGNGLLRYVLVREAKKTGEIMVVLVLSSHIMPSKNNFIKALRVVHPEIDTVLINEHYRISEKLLGEKETAILGKGFILDTILDRTFRISSKSMYPINGEQTEVLCKKVLEFASLSKEDIVLDAYCGIGTLGIVASEHVKKVISIDVKKDVIRDAVSNVKRNQIKNVDFYTNDAAEFVTQVAESDKQKPNVVFVDPPKGGCKKEFVEALVKLNPNKIIYISRSSKTLGENIKELVANGYYVQRTVGVDMMPWTEQIESVSLLIKNKNGMAKLGGKY